LKRDKDVTVGSEVHLLHLGKRTRVYVQHHQGPGIVTFGKKKKTITKEPRALSDH